MVGRLLSDPARLGFRPFLPILANHLTDAFERGNPLARDRLELGAELRRVVGDKLGTVARATDLDVERFLRREVRMPRLHRRNHVVDGTALERMDGRGPGMVEMAELRVPASELKPATVLKLERDPPVPDREDLGGAAVDQPEPGIVAGPADAVTGAKLDVLGPVDVGAAPPPPTSAARECGPRPPGSRGSGLSEGIGSAEWRWRPKCAPRLPPATASPPTSRCAPTLPASL